MHETIGIIEVRPDAPQCESKLARRLGGKSLLEWVVRRATDCEQLSAVVVLLPASAERIRELVPPDVPVVVGHGRDPLENFVSALEAHSAHGVVRICADTPFVDPVLIDRLVSTSRSHAACDYIGYCSSTGQRAILLPLGLSAEWCQAGALRQAAREATQSIDRQHVTRYVYSHPEKFRIRLVPVPAELDRHDVRLKIRGEEDWEHAQVIHEALGGEDSDWQRIAGLLEDQPALRERMAVLNRGDTAELPLTGRSGTHC